MGKIVVKKKTVKAVKAVKTEDTAIAKSASTLADLFGEDINSGNDGFDGVDSKSISIPFLMVLQPLSGLLDSVEDAKAGDIVDSIEHDVFKEIDVIPCAYQRKYVAWRPISEGGGYRGEYDADAVDTGRINYEETDDGIKKIGDAELKDTRNHYVLYRAADGIWRHALISMSSSQIKKSRRWCSLMMSQNVKIGGNTVKLPMWGTVYTITSVKEENDKGKWYGWEVTKKCVNEDPDAVAQARLFHDSVASGTAKHMDYNQLNQQRNENEDDEDVKDMF